jgi:hypothetical protein
MLTWGKGGLSYGSANDPSTAPDGLVLQSVENGLPVLHVAMNYRLNSKPTLLYARTPRVLGIDVS